MGHQSIDITLDLSNTNNRRKHRGVISSRSSDYVVLENWTRHTDSYRMANSDLHRISGGLHNLLDIQRRKHPIIRTRTQPRSRTEHIPTTVVGFNIGDGWDVDGQTSIIHYALRKTEKTEEIIGIEVQDNKQEPIEPERFYCNTCETPVAFVSDILQIDDIPSGTMQVNPHGFVHEVITVRCVQNAQMQGGYTPADSWFPGFVWRYLVCVHCQEHLGWSYHRPFEVGMTFAGLSRNSVFQR